MNMTDLLSSSGLGTFAAVAKICGCSREATRKWSVIPEEHCPAIEAETGIPCEQLRPDVHWVRDESGRITGYTVPLQQAA